MYFATAGIEVAFWIPPMVAMVISFFTAMGGVSGAFLLLPFQISFLGYSNPSVSATNQVFNIIAIPSGVFRYWRERRMVWPLVAVVIAGTLPGVFLGAIIRLNYLPNPTHFKLFAAAVLFYIGGRMVRELLLSPASDSAGRAGEGRFQQLVRSYRHTAKQHRSYGPSCAIKANLVVFVTRFTWKRIGYTFYGETFDVSLWGIVTLSFIVGIIGGIYGIGGGAIIAPFFITFFGLPVYTIAGAALMGTFVTSLAGVAFYQGLAPLYPHMAVAPDWSLGLLFGLGGMIGMYAGARCQKYVSPRFIKGMLAAVIVFTATKYVVDFFL